jgi:hypothetical protein
MRIWVIVTIIALARVADATATAPAIYVTAADRADVEHARDKLAAALAGGHVTAKRSFDLAVAANVASSRVRALVTVEVRLVVSDDKGKMLAVVCASASARGRPSSITKLRQQATADAIVAIVEHLQ